MAEYGAQKNDFLLKVVLIGAPSVGKTSIIQRFVTKKFSEDYRATIGADFKCRNVEIDNKSVLLQIWDTAGQERFRALATPFYRGANICVLVFYVSKKLTFDALEFWQREFLDHIASDNINLPMVIIGNKKDLGPTITEREVNDWIRQNQHNNMIYVETSAKDGTNINLAFEKAAELCLKQYANNSNLYIPQNEVTTHDPNENNDSGNVTLDDSVLNDKNRTENLIGQCSYC